MAPCEQSFIDFLSQDPDRCDREEGEIEKLPGLKAGVTAARPIPEELKSALHDSLVTATGRKVRLSFNTDEEIIGGVVARIGSTIFDGSVQNHLERLSEGLVGQ